MGEMEIVGVLYLDAVSRFRFYHRWFGTEVEMRRWELRMVDDGRLSPRGWHRGRLVLSRGGGVKEAARGDGSRGNQGGIVKEINTPIATK